MRGTVLYYACFNWPEHVRRCGGGNSALEELSTTFLSPSPVYQAWVSKVSEKNLYLHPRASEIIAPLLVACYFRLSVILGGLLHNGGDLNSTNLAGQTVLHLAVSNGDDDIVHLLLRKTEVDVNNKDKYGKSPLSQVAERGHETVVQMLLAKEEVDMNNKDTQSGLTPLSIAACHGHEKVVQMLLAEEGVDVNSKDKDGKSAHSWASEKGHQKVV